MDVDPHRGRPVVRLALLLSRNRPRTSSDSTPIQPNGSVSEVSSADVRPVVGDESADSEEEHIVRVRDLADGAPVAGVEFGFGGADGGEASLVLTSDEEGRIFGWLEDAKVVHCRSGVWTAPRLTRGGRSPRGRSGSTGRWR